MRSGGVVREELEEVPSGSLVQHSGCRAQLSLLRRMVEALSAYALAPSARTALWSIRELCECARVETWSQLIADHDILKAYAEGVGGCADRWLHEMAEYETAVAAASTVVESVAWDWARSRHEGRDALIAGAVGRLHEQARRLQLASVELARSVEREAGRAVTRLRFSGSGLRRRYEDVGTAARALRFEQ